MRHSVLGSEVPTEVIRVSFFGELVWVTGLVSVRPYPWRTSMSLRAAAPRATDSGNGAAPDMTFRSDEMSNLSDQRMLGQGEHDRRHEVRRRHAVLLQEVEELLEVEARHRDDGGAGLQRGAHDHRHAVDVVEGQNADQRVVGRDALVGRDLGHVGDQV